MERKSLQVRETVKVSLFWLFVLGVVVLGSYFNHLCQPLPVFQGTYAYREPGWMFGKRGETQESVNLSDHFVFQPDTVYVLSSVLTYDGIGDAFPSAFLSSGNLELEVYLDGQTVLRHSHEEKVFKRVQSVGKSCISIPLGDHCGGKNLSIELRNPMDHPVTQKLPGVTFGDSETQSRRAMLECMPSMLLGGALIFAVLILILLGNTVDGTQWSYIYFSLFALCTVLYQAMQNMFILYIWAKPFMVVFCEYFSVVFCPIPLLMSYRYRVRPYYQKTFDLLVTGSVLNLILQLFLHFTGIRDVIDMRNVTNLWNLFVSVSMVLIGLRVQKAAGDRMLFIRVMPILTAAILEIAYFYITEQVVFHMHLPGKGTFIGIGLLLTLLLLIWEARMARINGIRELERNNVLEKAAYRDVLTGVWNRAAITRDMEAFLQEKTPVPRLLVSADLNFLKKTNDSLGHGAGDALIIRAANALRQGLAPWGSVYRTGGDEFFAILSPASEEQWPEIRKVLEKEIEKQNQDQEVLLSIALGAADLNTADVKGSVALSDQRMYEHKLQQHEILQNL